MWACGRRGGSSMIITRLRGVLTWIVACTVALSVTRTSAQPVTLPTTPHGDVSRPWAQGTSEAEQAIARDLYAEGNAEFTESRFAQALAKYKEAIRHWDHPAIRFNMVVCLINLDQIVEARDNLERSLAYDALPLGNEAYAQGLIYRKLLTGQLAHIKAACLEPGAVVTLDGKYLFTGPATADQFLLPGEHQLTATKPGFRTAERTFSGIAGKQAAYDLRPSPEIKPTPPHWRHWKYVLGGGAVLSAAGALSYLSARNDLANYDHAIEKRCPDGCNAETVRGFTDLRAKKDGAGTKQVVAFSLFAVGGAAVVVGVLGLILDQPRVRPESSPVVPVIALGPEGATASLGWRF
jgi:hypothetical protein